MQTIETLRREHEAIGKVLASLERAADAVQSGGSVHETLFLKAIEFVTEFAHRLHQAKEEVFSRRLAEHGLVGPEGREHGDIGKFAAACLRVLRNAARGDPASRRMLAENAKAYVGILRSHIALEDNELFDAATRELTEHDDREIMSAFGRIERELGEAPAGRYERLAAEVEELGRTFGT